MIAERLEFLQYILSQKEQEQRWEAMLVFADWLEEHASDEHRGWRWLVEQKFVVPKCCSVCPGIIHFHFCLDVPIGKLINVRSGFIEFYSVEFARLVAKEIELTAVLGSKPSYSYDIDFRSKSEIDIEKAIAIA